MGSHKPNKHDPDGESARGRRHPGSGARGRQGSTMEGAPRRRHDRTASGAASTELDHNRSKASRGGREHREGTG